MPQHTDSEFGRGLCYCLGLFLEHAGRLRQHIESFEQMRKNRPDMFSEESAVEIWFNGAADHFYELEIGFAPQHLRERLAILRSKGIYWRLSMGTDPPATLKDAEWAIGEAKDLLRLIDAHHGVPTEKGTWE